MIWRTFARCYSHAKNNELFSSETSKQKTGVFKLSPEQTKVFAIIASSVLLCTELIHNELRKLRKNIKSLHDIFDFEKKSDPYIAVPVYSEDTLELSHLKQFFKDLKKDKSVWKAIPIRFLLKGARSQDGYIQRKSLEILSLRNFPKDGYDHHIVSQSIDFPTSLYLARSAHADPKLFRAPIKLPSSYKSLEKELTDIIEKIPINEKVKHHQKSIDNIRKGKIYASSHVDKTVMLGFETFDETSLDSQRSLDTMIIIHLLHAILTYSQNVENCMYMVRKGLLLTLRRVYERFSQDSFIVDSLCKIINNALLNGTDPHVFYETGWFHVIVALLKSDMHFVSSVKLLTNMQLSLENKLHEAYDNHACLLHPVHHHKEEIAADIVFIHGLQGRPMKTWRQKDKKQTSNNQKQNNVTSAECRKDEIGTEQMPFDANGDKYANNSYNKMENGVFMIEEVEEDDEGNDGVRTQCWPKDWLPQDVPNVRVLSVEYDTQVTHWMSNNHFERKTLKEQGDILLQSLTRAGVGKRPVVFVGHSMGGLLIKQMLCLSRAADMDLTNQVKGIVFYSVPHKGSYLVNQTRNASYILHPTDALLQLAEGSSDLKDLHEQFSYLVTEKLIKLRSFTEGERTNLPFKLKTTIVSQVSSNPGFGDFYVMKNHDHITICKPQSKLSKIYIMTKDFISSCLTE